MPGDITDNDISAMVDPALANRSGDPERKHPELHLVETAPPVYTAEDGAPTEEELRTLRRVPAKIPWKVWTIAFIELVERMSYYGTLAVMQNFIQRPNPGTATGAPPDPYAEHAKPGALNKGQRTATAVSLFNSFWVYLMPILGAYLADTYWGRYKTIFFAVVIATFGHILITVSGAPSVIAHPNNAFGLFMAGIVTMGVGTGAFKPNISPLIAEQVPQEKMQVETTKKGERVIVDPAVTITRIYSYFYMFINIGALIAQLGMVYAERFKGFYVAFLVPTMAFLLCYPVLIFCRKYYVVRKPEGSVLGPAIKLFLLALAHQARLNPVSMWKSFNNGSFWENVKPSRLGCSQPSWMNFDDAWVDEVARAFSACRVFLWYPLYWLTYNQISNNLISQAGTMALHGLPNDVLQNIDPLLIMIIVPLMDLVVYPALRKAGFNFTPIKRIFVGFMIGVSAMIWAAVTQYYIYKTSPCGKNASEDCPSPISVWVQTGAYALVALSEIFASVTSLEYAYTKAPKNMRSLVQAFCLFMNSISAALGEALVPLAENPLLVWNYGSAGIMAFVGGVLFWHQFRKLDAMEDQLNMLPTGHMGTRAEPAGSVPRPGAEEQKVG